MLLDGVNDVLIRGGQLDSESKLVSLSAPQMQRFVDDAVFLWQDAIQDLYTLTEIAMPSEVGETTIALIPEKRSYDLPTNLIQIRWPLENRTSGWRIWEFPGGYEAMRVMQNIPSQWRGQPYSACIYPLERSANEPLQLYMERTPTNEQAGQVYHLTYDTRVIPEQQFDLMPFEDDVYKAMVPLITTLWQNKSVGASTELGKVGYGRAARLLSGLQMRRAY